VGSQGTKTHVPPLLGCGVCPPADERDGGAEAAADLRSSGRTPQPLPVGTVLGDRVLDQLSEEVDDRWWRYGGVSFAGVHAAQYWVEFILWETLLNERSYKAIIELGTWEGGFSLYLSSQAEHRDMAFRTYDIHKPARYVPGFVQIDIFAKAEEIGEHLRRMEPVIVLCDGGNKPRELKTFARYVTPASTLVVHDWGTEMLPKDVPPGVEMVHEDWCVDLGSASRVFRKLPYA
jgi:cephalosporin hydroxylase